MILASPSPLGVALGIATAAAYGITAAAASRLSRSATQWLLGLAWLLHAGALAWGLVGGAAALRLRAGAVGHRLAGADGLRASKAGMYPQLKVRRVLAGAGRGGRAAGRRCFPARRCMSSASPWLPLHLALGIASYGLFGAAVVHAWLMTPRREADPASAPNRRAACRC